MFCVKYLTTSSWSSYAELVGSNRRRGRPRLTAPALEYQDEYHNAVEECVYSDTNHEEERQQSKKKVVKRRQPALRDDSDSDYDIFAEPPTQQAAPPVTASKTKKAKEAKKPEF